MVSIFLAYYVCMYVCMYVRNVGREFLVTFSHLFRLWDFMFASCYDAENNSAEG